MNKQKYEEEWLELRRQLLKDLTENVFAYAGEKPGYRADKGSDPPFWFELSYPDVIRIDEDNTWVCYQRTIKAHLLRMSSEAFPCIFFYGYESLLPTTLCRMNVAFQKWFGGPAPKWEFRAWSTAEDATPADEAHYIGEGAKVRNAKTGELESAYTE